MEVWNQWILAVHKNLNMQMAIIGFRNLEVKILIDRSQRSRGQTKDFSRERHLSGLYNNSSGSKMELI